MIREFVKELETLAGKAFDIPGDVQRLLDGELETGGEPKQRLSLEVLAERINAFCNRPLFQREDLGIMRHPEYLDAELQDLLDLEGSFPEDAADIDLEPFRVRALEIVQCVLRQCVQSEVFYSSLAFLTGPVLRGLWQNNLLTPEDIDKCLGIIESTEPSDIHSTSETGRDFHKEAQKHALESVVRALTAENGEIMMQLSAPVLARMLALATEGWKASMRKVLTEDNVSYKSAPSEVRGMKDILSFITRSGIKLPEDMGGILHDHCVPVLARYDRMMSDCEGDQFGVHSMHIIPAQDLVQNLVELSTIVPIEFSDCAYSNLAHFFEIAACTGFCVASCGLSSAISLGIPINKERISAALNQAFAGKSEQPSLQKRGMLLNVAGHALAAGIPVDTAAASKAFIDATREGIAIDSQVIETYFATGTVSADDAAEALVAAPKIQSQTLKCVLTRKPEAAARLAFERGEVDILHILEIARLVPGIVSDPRFDDRCVEIIDAEARQWLG